jgi:hypothetical protein
MSMSERVANAVAKAKSWDDLLRVERNIETNGLLDADAKAILRRKATQFGRDYLIQRAKLDSESLTDAESRILDVIGEYWALQKRAGKPISRTITQITNRGLLEAAEASVCRNRPTLGFQNLTDAGLDELSYEQIVVDYPEEFSPRAVWFARKTLGLPNATEKPPASEDVEIHAKTATLIEWLKGRVSPSGRIEPFTNEEAAASLGMGDLQRNGRAYGNVQSRIDFACFRSGLPPLGLAAITPFAKAWSLTKRDWDFPVASMQLATQGRAWAPKDFDRVLIESASLPGRAWVVWQEAMDADAEGVRKWAFGLTNDGAVDRQYKHGEKRTWELALDAVTALDSASPQEALAWIVSQYPDYNEKNLGADLAMLSVNSPSRTAYSQNVRPRRTDQGSEFDRLFKVGTGQGVRYELYDPAQHGVWEIFPDGSAGNRSGVSIRLVVDPTMEALSEAAELADASGDFDANDVEDARKRAMMAIVRRQGQPAFRKMLLEAYGDACAITGCNLPQVLEAAHVHPYKGDHTNVVSNGLLLRADIHTLFDLRLIAIDPDTLTVLVSPNLDGTEYAQLKGRALRSSSQGSLRISKDALAWHRSGCGW